MLSHIKSFDNGVYSFKNAHELPVLSEMPDPLIKPDGTRVSNVREWFEQRRYIKAMLSHYLYGEYPEIPHPENINIVKESAESVFGGEAIEEFYRIAWGGFSVPVRICRPSQGKYYPALFNIASSVSREAAPPVEREYAGGRRYIFVNIDRTSAAPDTADGPFEIPAVTLWAHCASVVLSAVASLGFIARNDVAVTGHSRNGKAALCAGIFDERFTCVMPNGSGCGGAGSFRSLHPDSEGIDHLTGAFPHWFSKNLGEFRGDGQNNLKLPFDMHFARVLIAPRGVINTEAADDLWANPAGTAEMQKRAGQIYDFLKIRGRNASYTRPGGHDHIEEDFLAQLEFCDLVYYNKKPLRVLFA